MTGFEDIFGYAHTFRHAENTSFGFIGNVLGRAVTRNGVKLKWKAANFHTYRQFITDPIGKKTM